MRIAIFGATGNIGRRIVIEALARGHQVTAVARDSNRLRRLPAAAAKRVANAQKPADVAAVGNGQDVVIGATRPRPGKEYELAVTAQALLAGVTQAAVRLLLVGGAGSLIVPASNGLIAANDPKFVPPAWRDVALACVDQFEVCRSNAEADWTYLSPPALLEPGERTGHYRMGSDELLVDDSGASTISMEDFSVALMDEAERPKHRRARFTVAY